MHLKRGRGRRREDKGYNGDIWNSKMGRDKRCAFLHGAFLRGKSEMREPQIRYEEISTTMNTARFLLVMIGLDINVISRVAMILKSRD
jgi:hypothetical protein